MSHADQTSDLTLPTSQSNGAGTNGTATAVNGNASSTAATNGNTNLEQQQKEMATTGGVSGIVPTLQ